MSDTVFRSSTPEVSQPTPNLPEPKPNNVGAEMDVESIRPVENKAVAVLGAMGISDDLNVMPPDDRGNLDDVAQYVSDIIDKRGLSQTPKSYEKVLSDLKEEMGLDADAEASIVLDRIGGVVKAWKNLSFIKDAKQKRGIFMKLARLESSKDMNRAVLELMNEHEVWQ